MTTQEEALSALVRPIETLHGVRADVLFLQLPFEEEAIRRVRHIDRC